MSGGTQIQNLTLQDVHQQFRLQPTRDLGFFPEWQGTMPEVSDRERETLMQIQADYLYQYFGHLFQRKRVKIDKKRFIG
jgi:hypothetical protein